MTFDAAYFGDLRPEIIQMIPDGCMQVLDVGCGYGALGRYLKEKGVSVVCGIEISPEAATEAEKVLDRVVVGSVETTSLPFSPDQFDCIVCADVLEHLVDPWNTLEKLKLYLKPEGCIIASLPNIGFHRIIRGLLKAQWKYEKSGILDRTHLRFFTLGSIEDLFSQNSMKIEKVERKIDGGLNIKALNFILLGSIKESLVIQYIVKAVNMR